MVLEWVMQIAPDWTPTAGRVEGSRLTAFQKALETETGRSFRDYFEMHRFSTERPAVFWDFYRRFSGLPFAGECESAISDDEMPQVRWFCGLRCNYAQAALFPPGVAETDWAVLGVNERGEERVLSYGELRRQVERCAAGLQAEGVGRGERVVAMVANVPETVVLLLACARLGVIFSSCSPDFGDEAAAARFQQVEPVLLFASSQYDYNGRRFSTAATVERLLARLPTVRRAVVLPDADGDALPAGGWRWEDWLRHFAEAPAPPFASLPFDHPLYILYSSGTTGRPKAIVHRGGGVMLKHHVESALHCDVRRGDRVLYFTTCGWMMWNWLVSNLLHGACLVLYEGSPSHPSLQTLWTLAGRRGLHFFGTSARFLHACRDADLSPAADLSALRTVASTGSPLSASAVEWLYRRVKADVHLANISGGTDIVGCFLMGNPNLPVFGGQNQVAALGADIAAFDKDGAAMAAGVGELVCRTPLPSMPLCFWGDDDHRRRIDTYFSHYAGVWRHGDLVEMTAQKGVIVHGRSDSTLNPGGVRIGTAEIYRPLEEIDEIVDAVAVGGKCDGDEEIVLLVVLANGVSLSDDFCRRVKEVVVKRTSPRHAPRRIWAVSDLPRTRSGKISEMAAARAVNGEEVPNRQSLVNPECLAEIAAVAKGRK